MICRLLAWLFRIDWQPRLTIESESWLDDLLARERQAAIRAHIRQEDTASGARPFRMSDVLYPKGTR